MDADPPFLSHLALQNVLSFGPAQVELQLAPLNVLVGPNGSGKSNLVAVLSLLASLHTDMVASDAPSPLLDWTWKGHSRFQPFGIEVQLNELSSPRLRYRLGAVVDDTGRLTFRDERVETIDTSKRAVVATRFGRSAELSAEGVRTKVDERLDRHRSLLAQVKDPSRYFELSELADGLSSIAIHRDWIFGPHHPVRRPQRADLDTRYLLPRYDNLGLVLQRLRKDAKTRRTIVQHVQALSPDFEDFDLAVEAGFVHLLIQERGWSVSATRLSEGTLRWLALVAILVDPEPPPLVVIEEPELGLHPDLIVRLASMLQEASTRTQLVVTTHSDILIDAIGDPAALLVFEKENGITRVARPDGPEVREWLKKYSLGRLWLDGEIGGKRW